MSHGHSHGGGGCRCAAEREEPPEQRGLAYGLYLRIDLERLQCLNESREGSGRGVFKPWEERTDRSKFVESDADEELLFNIPFTGNVKLKGVIIMGEDDDSHPSEMRLEQSSVYLLATPTLLPPELLLPFPQPTSLERAFLKDDENWPLGVGGTNLRTKSYLIDGPPLVTRGRCYV